MKQPFVGQVIWKLSRFNESENATVIALGTYNTVCVRMYSGRLEVWDSETCYESETSALAAAASSTIQKMQELIHKATRLFERLDKLRQDTTKTVQDSSNDQNTGNE